MFSSARKSFAFTLIELLIVVAIIAILAAIAVPNFMEAQTRAKVARAQSDMRTLATAVNCYMVDYNVSPRVYGFTFSGPGANTYNYYIARGDYGGNWYCDIPLTTPVAYISNVKNLRDPFSRKRDENGNIAYTGYWMLSTQGMMKDQAYLAWWQANEASYKYSTNYPDICQQWITMNGKQVNYNFLLVSKGPDEILNHTRFTPFTDIALINGVLSTGRNFLYNFMDDYASSSNRGGGTVVYDPTNGTKSNGDIFRIQ